MTPASSSAGGRLVRKNTTNTDILSLLCLIWDKPTGQVFHFQRLGTHLKPQKAAHWKVEVNVSLKDGPFSCTVSFTAVQRWHSHDYLYIWGISQCDWDKLCTLWSMCCLFGLVIKKKIMELLKLLEAWWRSSDGRPASAKSVQLLHLHPLPSNNNNETFTLLCAVGVFSF